VEVAVGVAVEVAVAVAVGRTVAVAVGEAGTTSVAVGVSFPASKRPKRAARTAPPASSTTRNTAARAQIHLGKSRVRG